MPLAPTRQHRTRQAEPACGYLAPRRRSRTKAAVSGAMVLIVAAGAACGRPAVPPVKWVNTVCSALSPWRAEVASLTERAQSEITQTGTPEQTKQSLTALLGGAETASDTALKEIVEAGQPDVAGGEAVSRRFVTALTRARDAYGHTKSRVEKLDTAEPEAFYDGVERAFGQLKREHAASVLDVETIGPEPLRQAFREVPECR